ncbi:tetratricopeptide repeat protein [bacterium]|nr:tetratricopeptide repeat protein [bacterium]
MNDDLITCPYCEAINKRDSRYCRNCGARIPTATVKEIAQILLSASLNLANGRFIEAERECKWIIEQDPFNADAHSLLGDIYERKGEIILAIEEYREAIRLAPGERFYRSRLEELGRRKNHKLPSLKKYLLYIFFIPALIFLMYRLLSLLLSQGHP